MEYRKIGCDDRTASLLGFGCMRFPTTPDGKIDEAEAEKMMDYAIASGVTYIDTAFPYHNGDSETFVGKVLSKYPRSSYLLATKLPLWRVKTLDDAKDTFDLQLKKLNKDYGITIILITHNMDEAVLADTIAVIENGKIILSGTPKEVFSEYEILSATGLDVPQITSLSYQLNKAGINIKSNILSVDEFIEEFLKNVV